MKTQEEFKEHLDKWYAKARQVSGVRIRTLTRKRLIEMLGEHGFSAGAEIGVDRGTFTEYMFKTIPDLTMLCVDPWVRGSGDERYETTARKLAPYKATLIREQSTRAVLDVPDKSLDFVYIDGDHAFDFVMTDLIMWSRKVKYGGVIAGHDYYRFTRAGIIPAVDTYTQQHMIEKWFLTDEKEATFFWVRERSFVDVLEDLD